MSDSFELPFRAVRIEGRYCILELSQENRGQFTHIASFYDEELADGYVEDRNAEADPRLAINQQPDPKKTTGPAEGPSANGLILTIEDAEQALGETSGKVLQRMRALANGSRIVQVSHRRLRADIDCAGSGSISYAIKRLADLGLIMISQPGDKTIATSYQLASDRLLNRGI